MGKDRTIFDRGLEGWDLDLGIPPPIVSDYPKSLEELPSILSSIESIQELYDTLAFFRGFHHKKFFFRGHPNTDYLLVSTIGRIKGIDYSFEHTIYDQLKTELEGIYASYRMLSFNEELFYYGIGRHLELTCRLLDWTSGFWEALSFVQFEQMNNDGALWVMMIPDDFPLENRSPFSIQDNGIHILKEDYFYPNESSSFPLAIQRRSHQHGFFSVVKEPWISIPLNAIPAESPIQFFCFIIPKRVKDILHQDRRIVEVNEWLYVKNVDPILEKIKRLNLLITQTVGNE